MPDLPKNPALLNRLLDELITFEQEMGSIPCSSPEETFNPCYKLVLAGDFLDIPRNRATLHKWVGEQMTQNRYAGECWHYALRQVTELRQEVQRRLEELAGPPTSIAPKPDDAELVTPIGKESEDERPDVEMFRAYHAAQAGIRQEAIGEQLNVSQPTISRWIGKVEEWAKKPGNLVPGLEELPKPAPAPRMFSVHPEEMDHFAKRRP
jgi:hypothetical protein